MRMMRSLYLPLFWAMVLGFLVGCADQSSIKPAESLDERSGMTVGALQEPIEFVESSSNAVLANDKRMSFAYLGPIEWDRMGEITYGLWVHVAPGNDAQVGDIRASGAVTLNLDDGPLVLSAMDAPKVGHGPYKPVVSWGQTVYFKLDVETLKRMAASQKLALGLRAPDDSAVKFLPSQDPHTTLTQFLHARGITDD
jgi:hypothetical protein